MAWYAHAVSSIIKKHLILNSDSDLKKIIENYFLVLQRISCDEFTFGLIILVLVNLNKYFIKLHEKKQQHNISKNELMRIFTACLITSAQICSDYEISSINWSTVINFSDEKFKQIFESNNFYGIQEIHIYNYLWTSLFIKQLNENRKVDINTQLLKIWAKFLFFNLDEQNKKNIFRYNFIFNNMKNINKSIKNFIFVLDFELIPTLKEIKNTLKTYCTAQEIFTHLCKDFEDYKNIIPENEVNNNHISLAMDEILSEYFGYKTEANNTISTLPSSKKHRLENDEPQDNNREFEPPLKKQEPIKRPFI